MKIVITYPPLTSGKGTPLLSQNRQFQYFNDPTYVYPVVPAQAATLLKDNGFDVVWKDGIAERWSYEQWLDFVRREKPDVVAMETKTPVVKQHWKIIDDLKKLTTDNCRPTTVLFGDHVTALPEESMQNSQVDFVLTGGDYDFLLLNLCNYLSTADSQPPTKLDLSTVNCEPSTKSHPSTPDSRLPTTLEPGIYYREDGEIKNTGPFELNHDLEELPFIDRDLTKWQLYAYKNGNFKYTPGTYIMAGRDCWWGKCTFCSWTTLYPAKTYRTVSPERHIEEVGQLITDLKVKEIFDDSGCFPKGDWLEEFCRGIIQRGYNKRVTLGCNMRVGALSKDQWQIMKKAHFRFVLIGFESAVQSTLDRLNKGIKVEQIEETVRMAKQAGLEPHITAMVGYPWETKEETEQTISFAKRLFSKGYLDTLQATIVVPYPGTPLFEESRKSGWLLTEDWGNYDMKQSVWKSPVSNEDVLNLTRGLYKAAFSPSFILRKIVSIRNVDDLKYLAHAGLKLASHLTDFRRKASKQTTDPVKN